jgi:cleavage and polyadenylation specificity factor subunit 1
MQSSRYTAGCFYTDTSGIFEAHVDHDSSTVETNGVDKTVTSTIQAAVNSEKRSQWLILVRPQGVMEVRSMFSSLPISLI